MKLVDVGLWLAAAWGRHIHHPVAADWFGIQPDDIVFCRVTQVGLLRLLSNPAVMGDDAIDRSQAATPRTTLHRKMPACYPCVQVELLLP